MRVLVCTVLALSASVGVSAQTVYAAGSSVHLGGATYDFGCTDLRIDGALTVGAGGQLTGVKNLVLGPAGTLDLSGASVSLAEQFSNQGKLVASAGSITRVDRGACPASGPLGLIELNPQPSITPVPSLDAISLGFLTVVLAFIGGFVTRRRFSR